MTKMRIYLDNSATTRAAPEVIEAMLPFLSDEIGNASSVHSFGQRAKTAVETARRQVAELINASTSEIVFVSGGTEADNLAIRGIAESQKSQGRHIVTSVIEHPAVLATCESLETLGFSVTYLPVSRDGLVDIEDVRAAINEDTILVSIMHANNEIGTIQPLEEIGRLIAERRAAGNPHLHFHTDAVQSAGKAPLDVARLGVDLLSLTAHKFHGPKGAGALYVRNGTRLSKLFHGGHHERDRRPGTENVPGIVGLGRAAAIARPELNDRASRMREMRDYLESTETRLLPNVKVNGCGAPRLPNVSNLSFSGIDGESLLISLDLKGIAVSTGSACSSGSLEPSHVLKALGLSKEEIRGSLRVSLGAFTMRDEIDYAVDALVETVERLRELAPSSEEPTRSRS